MRIGLVRCAARTSGVLLLVPPPIQQVISFPWNFLSSALSYRIPDLFALPNNLSSSLLLFLRASLIPRGLLLVRPNDDPTTFPVASASAFSDPSRVCPLRPSYTRARIPVALPLGFFLPPPDLRFCRPPGRRIIKTTSSSVSCFKVSRLLSSVRFYGAKSVAAERDRKSSVCAATARHVFWTSFFPPGSALRIVTHTSPHFLWPVGLPLEPLARHTSAAKLLAPSSSFLALLLSSPSPFLGIASFLPSSLRIFLFSVLDPNQDVRL